MKHNPHHSLDIYLKQHVLSSYRYRKGQQTENTCLSVKNKTVIQSHTFFFSLLSPYCLEGYIYICVCVCIYIYIYIIMKYIIYAKVNKNAHI